jgi:succinate dehydrogenase / fumarate reductase, membrane anchor subunit
MVNSVTNFGRNGLVDWLVQRVSALIIGVYSVFLMIHILCHPHMDFGQWQLLFSALWFKLFSVVTLLSICAHAWVGLWTVFTDYIKCAKLRVFLEVVLVLLLLVYLLWGISIFWR